MPEREAEKDPVMVQLREQFEPLAKQLKPEDEPAVTYKLEKPE